MTAASFVRVAVPLHAVNLSVDTKVSSSTTEDHAIVSYGVVTSPTLTPSSALTDAVSFTFEIKEGDTGFLGAFLFEVSKHRCWEREMEGLVEHIAF
jgi:catalase